MRNSDGQNNLVWVNKTFPNVVVKTHFGNTYLNRLYKNKWMLIYSNPYDMIPGNRTEKVELIDALVNLRELNCQLVGFSSRSFEEHLACTNWINSYLCDENVFPVFYQADNTFDTMLYDEIKRTKKEIKDPIYLVDGLGVARIIINGINPGERNMKAVLANLGKIILNEQALHKASFKS
ncbi:redoxin domain-containing protein [Lunatibacter salilacus]|uniref:redoxin domain-containing protein n=1 Tax=Lunatibacter salilacus TaxID=2483804 RepID=UPI00131E397B|nr:redoxin domain-containing protein [Lunatibacter salilacus]